MPLLSVYVTDETFARLEACSKHHGRSVDDLVEGVVEDAALRGAREIGYEEKDS